MKRFLIVTFVFFVFGFWAFPQVENKSVKDEDIKLTLSANSPLVGKTILVFPSPREYVNIGRDSDLKFLVDFINSCLSELGIEYVEYEKSLDLSKKFRKIYEEKKGQDLTLAQLLAQEVKAPIYIEVDLDIKVEPYQKLSAWILVDGSASLKAYDSSTARGLGSAQAGDRLVNNSSNEDKAKKVVLSYIAKKTLKELLPKLESYLAKGDKIEVKVIGLRTLKSVRDFSEFLNTLPGIKESKRKSVSGDTAVFEIIYSGGVESFLNDFADISASYPEYEKAKIDQSGNSVIISF
jgi:hypothetical protein